MGSSASVGSSGHDAGLRRNAIRGRGGHLGHGVEVLLNLSDLVHASNVLGLLQQAEHLLDSAAVVHPLLDKGLSSGLLGLLGGHHLLGCLTAGGIGVVALPLAALGLANLGNSRRGRSAGAANIVVHTLHVVLEVPLAREAISGNVTLTAIIGATERAVAVSVKTVSLALVAEKAGSRREAGTLTSIGLAAVGLQVRVDKLAVRKVRKGEAHV